MKNKELDELAVKIAKLEKEKLKKELSISKEMDSIKREKIASATVEMATELQKLKNEEMQEAQKEKERLEKERPLLEEKFRKYVKEHTARIQVHIEKAIEEIKKAEKISEETGVPFNSRVNYDFYDDTYVPSTSEKLEDQFSIEVVENFLSDYWLPNGDSDGWASNGWDSSSLTC